MAHTCELKFARTSGGYRLRVEGCGTMQDSALAACFVKEALTDPACSVVVDLSGASYLDSTFLGCLVAMYRGHGAGRVRIAAPKESAQALFGSSQLDRALRVSEDLPEPIGAYVTIKSQTGGGGAEMARHIMECHRQLAEIPGPQQQAFAAVAQQMARELEQRRH